MAKNNKKMTLMPLGDRVVLKKEENDKQKTASGIYIPDSAKKEGSEQAVVVAVGEGRRNDNGQLVPIRVKVGDTVMYQAYSPDKIEIDGEEFLVVSETSILAIIK